MRSEGRSKPRRRRCDVPICQNASSVYLYRFEECRIIEEQHFCRPHFQQYVPGPLALQDSVSATEPVEIDLDFLFCALDGPSFVAGLKGKEQDCRLNLRVRRRNAAELVVLGQNHRRTRTVYNVLEEVIKSLGAIPDRILIDRPLDTWRTTLHMRSPRQSVALSSTAEGILLAITSRLPIFATFRAINLKTID